MIRLRWPLVAFAIAGTFFCATLVFQKTARAAELTLYAGGYTRGAGDGLCALSFDPKTGQLSNLRLAAAIQNPDWLELAPDGRHLYAGGTKSGSGLTAFAVEPNGELREISSQTSENNPVSLAVDATQKWLIGAYYGPGTWAIWPLEADGKIGPRKQLIQHEGSGPNQGRQQGPHAHQAMISPDNRRIWITDLGIDRAMIYDFDAPTGVVKAAQPAFAGVVAGSGPRHLAFGGRGQFIYLVSEMGNTVSVFQGGRGAPGAIQTISTLPNDFSGYSSGAEIQLAPGGRYVFASNRGYDSIARFAVGRDGTLKILGWTKTGKEPRHFTFDPTGQWVLVGDQKERSISVFAFDPKTGDLTFSSELGNLLNEPTCLVFGK